MSLELKMKWLGDHEMHTADPNERANEREYMYADVRARLSYMYMNAFFTPSWHEADYNKGVGASTS